MVRSRTLEHRRYHDDGPHECPYPDCDGYIKVEVDDNYGADRDGNRGMTVYFTYCEECERDPKDFDEGVGYIE